MGEAVLLAGLQAWKSSDIWLGRGGLGGGGPREEPFAVDEVVLAFGRGHCAIETCSRTWVETGC